jgi:esterase/lipase superfamily enzyme
MRGLLPLLLMFLAGCVAPGARPVQSEPGALGPKEVDIYYVTDRAPDPVDARAYGPERGEISYGIASVAIPPNHEIGRQEVPSVFRFEWSPDERKHIAYKGALAMDRSEFLQQLSWAVGNSPDRNLMLFVHGYNVDFAQAVRRLAQFSTDLKLRGPAVLFSWPSQDSLTGYLVDETNAEWAQPHLVDLLNDLLEGTPAKRIFVVAHSMGARLATRGLTTLSGDRWLQGIKKIRELILVAPDIDADLFRQDVAPRLAETGVHVTLYASSEDRALKASKAFHGYPRAGDSGEGLVIVPGVETVEARDASSGLLGHSYFAEDRRIMEDIFALLQTGQRANDRFGLAAIDSGDGRYWVFRK